MENVNVRGLVTEIRENLSQKSVSLKDETRVMKEMLNDMNYNVVTYDNNGPSGTICPAQEARALATSILSNAADIPKAEAQSLADNYEFSKNDAQRFIGIGKEFVNTYLGTGRKMSFGGRENSEIAIIGVDVAETEKRYPQKRLNADGTPVMEDGKPVFDFPTKTVPAHGGAKVFASCPAWLYK